MQISYVGPLRGPAKYAHVFTEHHLPNCSLQSIRNILEEGRKEGMNKNLPPAYGLVYFAMQVVQTEPSSLQYKSSARDVFSERHSLKHLRCSCGSVCQESWLPSSFWGRLSLPVTQFPHYKSQRKSCPR